MSRTSTEPAPRAPIRRAAFTLLEVLGAVAILGIWYTIIATGALRGLRSEGENLRLIRASLIADEQLAEIESGILLGSPLELIEEELEEEEYTIRLAVTEFANVDGATGEAAVPGGSAEDPGLDAGLASVIASEQETSLEFLRAIRVEVAWMEGIEERSIQRESFAFDREAWQRFIQSHGASLEENEDDEEDEDDAAAAEGDLQDREGGP